jgi:hypothetical protein
LVNRRQRLKQQSGGSFVIAFLFGNKRKCQNKSGHSWLSTRRPSLSIHSKPSAYRLAVGIKLCAQFVDAGKLPLVADFVDEINTDSLTV